MNKEKELIKEYFTGLSDNKESMRLNNDAAKIRSDKKHLVISSDMMIENSHFYRKDNPKLLARKLIRINLSDLAAMGAKPYGYLLNVAIPKVGASKWLGNFYYNIDITIDPVRPFILYPGCFDGYPMGIEQSLFGVAMFTSDELNQNRNYTYYKNDEIVHVDLDANDISSKVIYYLKNLDNLYQLAEKGRKKTISFNNLNDRMNRFIAILKSCI